MQGIKKPKKYLLMKKINTFIEDIFFMNKDTWDSKDSDYKRKVRIGRKIALVILIICFFLYMSLDSEPQKFYETLPRRGF